MKLLPLWPEVLLGDVLCQRKENVFIDDLQGYKRCRVQLHARGVVLRDVVTGSEIKTKRQQVCRSGEFLVAEIDAKGGGFGIVPPELEGAIVSSHYFVFEIDQSQLDPGFLGYFVKTTRFQEQIVAEGSTNYAAIRPADVLSYCILLPPLEEQRRIVARIDELAAKIGEARELRQQTTAEVRDLMATELTRALDRTKTKWPIVAVEDISVSVADGDHQPPPKSESGVPFLFIGNVAKGRLNFSNCKWVSHEYFQRLQPTRVANFGDILYTAVGSYGTPCLVDTHQPFCFQRHIAVIKPDRHRITSEYLIWALRSRDVYAQASNAATGSAQPTVPLRAIRKLRVPLPSLDEQRLLVEKLNRFQLQVWQIQDLQGASTSGLADVVISLMDQAFKGEL